MKNFNVKRPLSLLLSMVLLLSGYAVMVPEKAEAASTIKIAIEEVTKRYQEAASFLQLCNEYRSAQDLPEWQMDAKLLETAMTRACELSVYASTVSPDGTKFINSSTEERGEVDGIDLFNNANFINEAAVDSSTSSTMNSSTMQSVGVGIVMVRGKKYVSLLTSSKTLEPVASTTLTQANQTVNMDMNVQTSLLKNVSLNYSDGQELLCGGDFKVRMIITNMLDSSLTAVVAPSSTTVTSSDTSVFTVGSNGMVTPISNGTSTITVTLKAATSIKASAELVGVSKSLASCYITPIPDQLYTGSPITPAVTITNDYGYPLTLDTDYTVVYSNNINVGTAKVTIKGAGAYIGQKRTTTFNIVNNPNLFKVTLSISQNEITLGERLTLVASVVGGTSPYKYTFASAPNGTSDYTTFRSASTTSSAEFNPSSAGTYSIRVTASDNGGRTATATVVVKVIDSLSATLKADATTVAVGKQAVVRVSAAGGTAPYQFYCSVLKPNASSYTLLSDYSTKSVFTYTLNTAGTYKFQVRTKDNVGKVVTKYISVTAKTSTLVNTSTVTPTTAGVGQTVTLKGLAEGGVTPYTFSYAYKKSTSSTWTYLSDGYVSSTYKTFKTGAEATYNVKVVVKDGSGMTVEKIVNVVSSKTAVVVNNSTISKTVVTKGGTVTVKAIGSGGTTPYTYAFYYKKSSSSNWTTVGSGFTSTATYTFKPASAAVYNIKTIIKDSKGKTAAKIFYLTSEEAPVVVNNSTISATTVTKGTTVTLKGAASGGTTPYTYSYYYKKSSGSTWTLIGKANTTYQTVTFQPASVTTYDVKVVVKDNNGTTADKTFVLTVKAAPALVNKSTVSASSVQKGTAVTLTGTATGGTTPYTYSYYYKKSSGNGWSVIGSENTSSTTASFTPYTVTTYDLKVVVKDKNGSTAAKSFTLTVTAPPQVQNNSTVSPTTVVKGNTVTIKGAASGGTAPYTYSYYYKKDGNSSWTVIGSENTGTVAATFVPYTVTTYSVRVVVKDAAGTSSAKEFTVTVKAPPALTNNSSVSSQTVTVGDTVTLTGKASGGTTPYTYSYYYKKSSGSSWYVMGTENTTATSASFNPASATTYDLKVIVKDRNGSTAVKTFTLTVNAIPALVNNASISATKVAKGTKVTIRGAASGGVSPYTYSYYYKKSTSSNWSVIGTENSTATSGSFTPGAAATYDVKVIVKDSSGRTAAKTFTVTST